MKKKATIFLFASIIIGIFFSIAEAAGGWVIIKNSDGIKVYEREVPGTELMEYVGVTTVDAKMEVIGEVLRDIPSYRNWLADCYGAQVEKKYDRNTFLMYLVLKPPLIEERDIILKDKTVYDWDNGRASISFFCTDEVKIPLEKRRIRVTVMNGVFDMEYLGRNKTKFIYRLKVDPAGSIPKKVAYSVMKSYPYDTLKGLRKMILIGKYSVAAKGSDEERQIETRTKNEAYVRKILTGRLSLFVKDKGALGAIVAADKNGIKSIMNSGVSYDAIEKATTDAYIKYIEKTVTEKKVADRLKNDRSLIDEITDMVVSDCGATNASVDSIVEKYRKKHAE